jgi:riboflavin biosynthesis pyrimidine reductase
MEHVVDGVARTPKAVAGDLRWADHAIAILGEQVSDEYLSELREDGVSYLFAGKDGHDLRSAVDLLGETFGIKTLLLQGGGMINGAFLKNRLIDEISLLVYPGIDNLKGVASIFDYAGSPDEKPGMGQSLRHIDCRPENVTGSRKRLEMQSEDTWLQEIRYFMGSINEQALE